MWEKTEDDLETDTTWIDAMGMEQWREKRFMGYIYIVAMHTSLLAMFGGVGSVAPNNYLEYAFLTFILLTGCFFWAYVISTLCSLLATLDPHKTQFRNTMDELNHFMVDNQLRTDHRVRIRQFFRATREYTRRASYKGLLTQMSDRLRGDMSLVIGVNVLSKVWYFNLSAYDIELDFLAHISLVRANSNPSPIIPSPRPRPIPIPNPHFNPNPNPTPNPKPYPNPHPNQALESNFYEAQDRFRVRSLTVITRGSTCMGLRILIKGYVMGLECIIKPAHQVRGRGRGRGRVRVGVAVRVGLGLGVR